MPALHFHPCKNTHKENPMPEPTATTNARFYLPPKSPDARPEDVVGWVRHYADLAGVEPTDADYARMGYWEAVGRVSDARVMAGSSPVGQEATWAYRAVFAAAPSRDVRPHRHEPGMTCWCGVQIAALAEKGEV